MNSMLRHGGALVLAVGLGGCTPPDPPVLAPAPAAPAAIAPAQRPASNDDMAHRPIDDAPAPVVPPQADEDSAPAVVSVALDHAGEVLIGQRFSEVEAEGTWHSAGLHEATQGRCEYYERGTLPEGVAMMVQDGDVVRFDLAPIDDSGQVVVQPGPFGLRLDMPRAQALQLLPSGVTAQPYGDDPEAGESLLWQDPGSDLAIRVEIVDGVVSRMYWGASGAVDLIEGCT
ncbi:hypothetical protein ACK1O1_13990 [Stenotrophomonas maltophilia]|uniref:hypothetical protein n=1 Tax=Stenotrophomonas TaxID=40323 RepID=UPI00201CB6F2|nr:MULTISPECIES: hypothetical protein [Stenotrophomonas]MBN5024396.1 hypothetical protein [Stenotrophomonas maltophilia]MDH1273495.1 hypothetical protein [Stenotrophomonas sp. GD03937]MDH1485949.1 hypothetical protein [Stenotrophomonas sp. GD03712]UQY95746.1 hypothetical protein LZ605_21950 [Stenotrophomonas maltophilia]WON67606.1 hypothetical protein RWT08_15505 [Stenotrophomonas maltophilia]